MIIKGERTFKKKPILSRFTPVFTVVFNPFVYNQFHIQVFSVAMFGF